LESRIFRSEAIQLSGLDQQTVLAMTNTNEGVILVNQTAEQNPTFYAQQLFPNFGTEQGQETARQYTGLGSPLNQTNLIHEDCKNAFAILRSLKLNPTHL
jgi:hypothetical protein